ncbi:DNA-binding protein [Thelephora ganbajun]|uniref:DNA-binding protein n=1 Tax=Thelephora ganbajun TaxID=370292 RepID=A0ACB6Z6Z4_THEGA|nr:DNA-binding protein [Thelephora ganbajun]
MQAQAARSSATRLQATLTAEQSLQTVQTLLQAGLGCIMYLRDLLPEDNFSESYLTSSSTPGLSNEPSQNGSFASPKTPKQTISSFKIMTIKRGFTDEADQLLNCLERGIFDALERQYLKSFVFAIYLDNNNPNNVVESYTFNFNYFEVPGTGVKIPVMSLGEDLMKMSLNDSAPVTNKPARPPTLGEVKKSLRSLARRLIHAASQMDELPKRRFAAFKLFYYDHTPDDYEPPYFRKGDADKDKWYFTTHDRAEVPERTDVGRLETGWHSVEIQVASITSFLPSSDNNKGEYLGTVRGPGIPSFLTPLQESELRRKQAEAQIRDAEKRKIVFDADPSPDTEITSEVIDPEVPLGVMDDEGNVVTNPTDVSTAVGKFAQRAISKERIIDAGHAEKYVTDVRELVGNFSRSRVAVVTSAQARSSYELGIGKTQTLPPTQPMSEEGIEGELGPVPTTQAATLAGISHGVETQVLKNMFDSLPPSSQINESEMLGSSVFHIRMKNDLKGFTDLETQKQSLPREGSTESFTGDQSMKVDPVVVDRGLDCCCEVDREDADSCWCNRCGRWYHTWCMGYHGARDKRIPESYQCFDCRIRSDKNWNLIEMRDQHLVLISDFKDFAIFRRAIKIAEETKSFNDHLEFTRRIGCPPEVATQLFRRLQTEGFIVQVETVTDELGLVEIQKPVTGKRRRPRTKAGPKYKLVAGIKKSRKYKDYFDPERDIAMRLARLGDLRKSREDQNGRVKRVKISLGNAMDLGD